MGHRRRDPPRAVAQPVRDLLQRWRRCLASLLFFTVLLTEHGSMAAEEAQPTPPSSSPPPPDLSDVDGNTCAGVTRDVWVPSEAVVDYVCPPACHDDSNTNQCLYYLNESLWEAACLQGEERLKILHLPHCCESSAWSTLPPEARKGGVDACKASLKSAVEADQLARRITCEFDNVLDRYDCSQVYSVRFGCDDCKAAYRRWVCSSLIPHFAESSNNGSSLVDGQRVWPCRAVCHSVEQRCPFILPGDRLPGHPTQYAGEPSFICLDPNIPEIQVQLENSAYGDHRRCCYTYCPWEQRGHLASFLLPLGHRENINYGRGMCFHCHRGREEIPRSLTPGAEPPATSGSAHIYCWRLLVLQGLLLARRSLSRFCLHI